MGHSMTGLFVRMGGEQVPQMLEELFDRKIIKTYTETWSYDRQFDGVDDWEIAVLSDGNNSALYFGPKFFNLSWKIFPDNPVYSIPAEYLYYGFVESSMTFVLSYKKKDDFLESYFSMDGAEFVHVGDHVLGLTMAHDIVIDGMHLAMQEFGLDPDKVGQAAIYTFSPEIRKTDPADKDLRYLVQSLGREVDRTIRDKRLDYTVVIQRVMRKLKEKRITIAQPNFSADEYKIYLAEWKNRSRQALEELESHLTDKVILQQEATKAFAQLVYLYYYYERRKAKKEIIAPIRRAIIIVVLAALVILIAYLNIMGKI